MQMCSESVFHTFTSIWRLITTVMHYAVGPECWLKTQNLCHALN